MSKQPYPYLVFAVVVGLAMTVSACTRSASGPTSTPTAGNGTPAITNPDLATMAAVQSTLLTQTALAAEAGAQEVSPEMATPTSTALIPVSTATPTPLVTLQPTATQPPNIRYQVVRGDWVYSIARKFNVDPDAIISLNGLPPPYVVKPGQWLLIPSSSTMPPSGTPLAGRTTHVVRAGEWVYSIARKYGISPYAIIQANHLYYPYIIHPGDVLIIP